MSLPSSNGTAWRAWYEVHAGRLLLYARQWLPERADAEDVVQAGFVKFWRHKPHPAQQDVPLLYATVRCAALDFLKSRSRRQKHLDTLAAGGAEDCWWDADSLVERERAGEMRAALEGLSTDQREVVVLRVWAGMTFAEIAATLDESINTITARYRYALANLKKLLPEDCHERT